MLGVVVARANHNRPDCPTGDHAHNIDHDDDNDNYHHDDDHHHAHHNYDSPSYDDNDSAAIA